MRRSILNSHTKSNRCAGFGRGGFCSRMTVQRTFLIAMGALTALFLLLLFAGNLGGQTDIVYLGGEDAMADMLHTEEYARTLNPYGYDPSGVHVPFKDANYPPLAYLLFYLCDVASFHDVTTPWAMTLAMVLGALGVLLLLWGCWRMLSSAEKGKRLLLAAACSLCAPTLYAFERGNIILLAAVLCLFFLLGYESPRPIVREAAFAALAVAAALKIYPALLGLLLLRQRRFSEALRLMLYGVLAVFAPFLCMEGGFANLPLLLENFGVHTDYYTRLIYPRFGFRLFASLTYDTPFVNPFLDDQLWKLGDKMYRVMPVVDALLALGCALCMLTCRRRFEAVLAVMLILVNYPVNSGYYTALYLLIPLTMLLDCDTLASEDLWTLGLIIAVIAPVQIPIPYALLGVREPILCNLSYLLHNLAAYALFVLFAVKGYAALVGRFRTKGRQSGAVA